MTWLMSSADVDRVRALGDGVARRERASTIEFSYDAGASVPNRTACVELGRRSPRRAAA
jgi:hypothetical protein